MIDRPKLTKSQARVITALLNGWMIRYHYRRARGVRGRGPRCELFHVEQPSRPLAERLFDALRERGDVSQRESNPRHSTWGLSIGPEKIDWKKAWRHFH